MSEWEKYVSSSEQKELKGGSKEDIGRCYKRKFTKNWIWHIS